MNTKKVLAAAAAVIISCQTLISNSTSTVLKTSAVIRGDISGNGSIDILDAVIIAKFLLKPSTLTAEQQKIADFNGDGKVDILDAVGIAKKLLYKSKPTVTVDSETMKKINEVVKLVNAERAKKNIAPVTLNVDLRDAAMVRAKEIVEKFDHTRPNGSSCFSVLNDYKISYSTCGENIAAGQSTPQSVMDSWVNSSGHYANIMNPEFTEIGIGYYYDSYSAYRYNWVQLFIG